MQEGGVLIIELGVSCSDPQANGATIWKTNQVAITNWSSNHLACFEMVVEARKMGLVNLLVLMGYCNISYYFGIEQFWWTAKPRVSLTGLLLWIFPQMRQWNLPRRLGNAGWAMCPWSLTNTNDQIKMLAKTVYFFPYCVSVTGVTAARADSHSDLNEFIGRLCAGPRPIYRW